MHIGRREVIKVFAGAGLMLAGGTALARRLAAASSGPTLGLRAVIPSDAPTLQELISYCVASEQSFFGKCGEWTLGWAQEFIQRRPASIVLTKNDQPVAFMEIPTLPPPRAPLASGASAADVEKDALREHNRTTFLVRSAGIDSDPDAAADAVRLFYTLLYYGFQTAHAMGYQYVEAYAPWDKHPLMDHKWTDYAGCQQVAPVAQNQAGGSDLYYIRWKLDEAIGALAQEDRFNVLG